MAFYVKHGTGLVPASAGTQTISWAASADWPDGINVKAVMIRIIGRTTEGFGTHISVGVGFSDGMHDYTLSGTVRDGSTNPVRAKQRHARKIVSLLFAGPVVDSVVAEGNIINGSFGNRTFQINWTTAGTQYIYQWTAYGDDEGASWFVGDTQASLSAGNQAVTGVGFKPKGGAFLTFGYGTGTTPPAEQSEWHMSLGFCDDQLRQGCAHAGCGATGGAYHGRFLSDDAAIIKGAAGKSAWTTTEAPLVSWDSDGFTVNNPGMEAWWGYLLCDKGAHFVGIFDSGTGSPTDLDKAYAGVGFTAKGLVFGTHNHQTVDADVSSGRWGCGAIGLHNVTEASIWAGIGATSPAAEADMAAKNNKALMMVDTANPTAVDEECDGDSYTSDGFILDWTTAQTTARGFVAWAIGDTPTAARLHVGVALGSANPMVF